MSQYVLLNHKDHSELRINTTRSRELGDDIMYVMTFPHEFRDIQSCYPICFRKDPDTGVFHPVALFGLEPNQNLFLENDYWDASYIPLMVRRHPFLIGMKSTNGNTKDPKPVISIDIGNPRVNKSEGERLFTEDGNPSEFTHQIMKILEAIHVGYEDNSKFINKLIQLDLLESFTLEVTLTDGSKHELSGFYTIKETSLSALSSDQLSSLHSEGYLLPIYMAVASHSRMRVLVNKKDERAG